MPEADVSVLDRAVLAELAESVGGDRAFVVELVETYLADAESQLAGIDAALSADDADATVRPAHTLKSSSATLGAMQLAGMARAIEVAGRSGSLAGLDPEIDAAALRRAWDAASRALRAWIEAGEGS